jgi:hypothetical protein
MRYLHIACFIMIGFMASGCATGWIVAEARKPGEMDIDAWVDNEPEDATVVWKRRLALPAGIRPTSSAGNPLTTGITRRIVFEPEAGSPCEKLAVCFDCPATIENPCEVLVSYRMLGKAETYGFLVQSVNKPDQEMPLKGKPYMWLLLPIAVGIDAGVVATIGFFCALNPCWDMVE